MDPAIVITRHSPESGLFHSTIARLHLRLEAQLFSYRSGFLHDLLSTAQFTNMAASVEEWAVPRMSQIMGLDKESARAVLVYTNSLSKQDAANHLAELMGSRPQVLEFITSYNQRRQEPPSAKPSQAVTTNAAAAQSSGAAPSQARPRKKKPQIHALPPRQIVDSDQTTGAYQKRSEDDYMPTATRQRHKDQVADGCL